MSFLALSAICYWVVNGKRGRRSDGRHTTLDQLLSKVLPGWMVDNMVDVVFWINVPFLFVWWPILFALRLLCLVDCIA